MQLRAFTSIALAGASGLWAGMLSGLAWPLQLAGLLGPAAALLTIHRPTLGFLALFALLPLVPAFPYSLFGRAINYALPALLIGLVGVDVLLRDRGRVRPLPGRLGLWFILFVSWMLVCTLVSGGLGRGLTQVFRYSFLLAFLVALWHWIGRRDLGRVLMFFGLGMLPVALYAIYLFISLGPVTAFSQSGDNPTRLASLYQNPNTFGLMMANGAIVLAPWILVRLSRRQTLRTGLETVGMILILIALGVALVTSFSRGSFVYAGVGLAVLGLAHRSLRWILVGGGLAVGLVLLLLPLPEWLAFVLRLDSGASLRGSLWMTGWQLMLENPVFGIGPGSGGFEELRSAYIGSITNRSLSWSRGGGAHNIFLHRGAVMGIPGLLLTLGLFTMLFRTIPGVLRDYARGDWVAGAAAAGIVGLTARAFFEIEGTVGYGPISDSFFFLLALIALHTRERADGLPGQDPHAA